MRVLWYSVYMKKLIAIIEVLPLILCGCFAIALLIRLIRILLA